MYVHMSICVNRLGLTGVLLTISGYPYFLFINTLFALKTDTGGQLQRLSVTLLWNRVNDGWLS